MGLDIGTALWDLPGFLDLSESAQLLYIYLITGPEAAMSVPGLILAGSGALSEARHCSPVHMQKVMDELSAALFIEIDTSARLIAVPAAPTLAPPGNTNVVKGWYRRWRALPASPIKLHHLEPLRYVICSVRRWTAVWESTFGTILPAEPSQPDLFSSKAFTSRNGHDVKKADNGESLSEGLAKGSKQPTSEVARLEPFESIAEDTRSGSLIRVPDPRSGSLIPDPEGKPFEGGEGKVTLAEGTAPGNAESVFAVARRLWAIQESLIGDLPYETIHRDPTDGDLSLVKLALEQYPELDLVHVLKVFAARAASDGSQAIWFNRRDNWQPKQIERALRMPVVIPESKGRVRAGGKKKYGRSAFDTP